jgi:hypothetical protein
MRPFKLSPKAAELLARIEAREGKGKDHQGEGVEQSPASKARLSPAFVGLGPNPLDSLDKAERKTARVR